jgi:hypothetical protein
MAEDEDSLASSSPRDRSKVPPWTTNHLLLLLVHDGIPRRVMPGSTARGLGEFGHLPTVLIAVLPAPGVPRPMLRGGGVASLHTSVGVVRRCTGRDGGRRGVGVGGPFADGGVGRPVEGPTRRVAIVGLGNGGRRARVGVLGTSLGSHLGPCSRSSLGPCYGSCDGPSSGPSSGPCHGACRGPSSRPCLRPSPRPRVGGSYSVSMARGTRLGGLLTRMGRSTRGRVVRNGSSRHGEDNMQSGMLRMRNTKNYSML